MSQLHLRSLIFTVLLVTGATCHAITAEEPSFYNGFEVENGLIAPGDIDHGGPGRDGIPALDAPVFLSGKERKGQIKADDRVLGLYYNGVAKAYPISILDHHELVNDQFAETPILISYCPLCGTGMVFLANVKDQALNFGVSGLIYNSNVLLYDRNTGSLWSQILKKAVTGPMKGAELTQIPAQYTTWESWLNEHPDSLLLSRATGFERDYDYSPYEDYKRLPTVTFSTFNQDTRLYSKTWVVGITVGEESLALPFAELDKLDKPLRIRLGDTELSIQWDRNAQAARAFDENGKEVPTTSAYWFSWVAFHPDTGIYGMGS
ncbi:MAG: DUF3179 domain-containing protein [Halioglobus sp.]|nr:DUF3179 domain-containing protein [Halioglobus sp.]